MPFFPLLSSFTLITFIDFMQLEEVARKSTEEIVSHKRTIEELKDSLESKQSEIQNVKKVFSPH